MPPEKTARFIVSQKMLTKVRVVACFYIILMILLISFFWDEDCEMLILPLHFSTQVLILGICELFYFLNPYVDPPPHHNICSCYRYWALFCYTCSTVFYFVTLIALHNAVFTESDHWGAKICHDGDMWELARALLIITYSLFVLLPLTYFVVFPTVKCCQKICNKQTS